MQCSLLNKVAFDLCSSVLFVERSLHFKLRFVCIQNAMLNERIQLDPLIHPAHACMHAPFSRQWLMIVTGRRRCAPNSARAQLPPDYRGQRLPNFRLIAGIVVTAADGNHPGLGIQTTRPIKYKLLPAACSTMPTLWGAPWRNCILVQMLTKVMLSLRSLLLCVGC